METATLNNPETESKISDLKAIHQLLQSHLKATLNEVDFSAQLLESGAKTSLSESIENSLNNPIAAISQLNNSIDQNIKAFINKMVIGYLKQHANLINGAYRTKTTNDDLHYCIVLNDDTTENRCVLFDFFDQYEEIDFSSKFPVYFQFVPDYLINKISTSEKLSL